MKKWKSTLVPILIPKPSEGIGACDNVNETLNNWEQDGWTIESCEPADAKGYNIFILASKEEDE